MAKHNDEHWMRAAIAEAQQALAEDELPIGCVIVANDEIIGCGRRRNNGHVTLDHAEPQAIRQALNSERRHGREAVLYCTLEPCLMCFAAIAHSRIGRVVYALRDPAAGGTGIKLQDIPRYTEESPKVEGGLLETEVRHIMKNFFQTTKHPYWSTQPENILVKHCLA